MDPEALLRFLLFEPTAPRSIRCGMMRIVRYLERLPRGGAGDEAQRVVGRLEAKLHYDEESILQNTGPVDFCLEARQMLRVAHDAINRGYFRT